jgi:hypothetical protein
MATITANTGAGNWNNTATWVGGVVPDWGDLAIIPNGATVTADGYTTNADIEVQSGGAFIQTDIEGTLNSASHGNVTITGGSATWNYDSASYGSTTIIGGSATWDNNSYSYGSTTIIGGSATWNYYSASYGSTTIIGGSATWNYGSVSHGNVTIIGGSATWNNAYNASSSGVLVWSDATASWVSGAETYGPLFAYTDAVITGATVTHPMGVRSHAAAADVRHGIANVSGTGTCRVPVASDVRSGTLVDATTGTAAIPSAANVRAGTATDNTTGTLAVPAAGSVALGVPVDDTAGTAVLTAAAVATVLQESADARVQRAVAAGVTRLTDHGDGTKTLTFYDPQVDPNDEPPPPPVLSWSFNISGERLATEILM